ncbi:ABC transporter permease [Fulvivirga sediminis]|uniref:ABC transporter permease n=1 Tax=Fulvivirga sediminis TaxID=2803949 RepID=A0A937K1I5_9BACT|nr:ABC transporter permease [Fulvivirga sediminis]MBL3657521.1 ABC transporter permease [Fulvivirga sediminis]
MFTHYLKVFIRDLFKNKLYISINVLGLAFAFTFCMISYLSFEFNENFNAFHTQKDNIYRINSLRKVQGELQHWGVVPLPIGDVIKNDIANIDQVTRFVYSSVNFKKDYDTFSRRVAYADDDFLDIFSFPLKYGSKSDFGAKDYIYLSEETSELFFKSEDPVGRTLRILLKDNSYAEFLVGGVFEKIPENSSLQFDAVTNFQNYLDFNEVKNSDWSQWVYATFFTTSTPQAAAEVEKNLSKYLSVQNSLEDIWDVNNFYIDPMMEVAPDGRDMYANYLEHSFIPSAIVSPIIMAGIILLVACFNFTNTSIALSSKRLKEIGLRKVFGATHSKLISQFLIESLFFCFLSMLVALIIAQKLIPAYSSLWVGLDIELHFNDIAFIVFLLIMVLIASFLAGAYPAFFISKHEPAQIFKEKLKFGSTTVFSKFLLTIQFSSSLAAVAAGVIFMQNAEYQNTLDYGYDKESLIVVKVNGRQQYERFYQLASQHSNTIGVSGSQHQIGVDNGVAVVKSGSVEEEVDLLEVGDGYVETLGLQIINGRNFHKHSEADRNNAVLVNEQLMSAFGWKDAVGKKLEINGKVYEAVGVLKNFYNKGMWEAIKPVVVQLTAPDNFHYLITKTNASNLIESNDYLKQNWNSNFSEQYESFYQEDTTREARVANSNVKSIFLFLAVVALILSVTGLFTMVSIKVIRKLKEIAIRKSLGASSLHIFYVVNKEFVILLILATILGSAFGYLLVNLFLDGIYAYHVKVSILPFLLSALVIFLVAFSTISYRIISAIKASPIKALRSE